jgi:hypothetical protein
VKGRFIVVAGATKGKEILVGVSERPGLNIYWIIRTSAVLGTLSQYISTLMSPCDVCSVTDMALVFKVMVFDDEGDAILGLEEEYLMLRGRCW